MPTLTIADLAGRAVKQQLLLELTTTIINQSKKHTNEFVQEVIGEDSLSMTVDIACSENGVHGYFCKLFVLELSHIVDQNSYKKMRKH